MVVMDPRTREVLALVGGYNYRPGGWDRSQRASRQPGSAFKPFVYATAIESGRYTAASIVNDAPEVYDLWKPQNYEKHTFQGPMRLRAAFAESMNTVAIRLTADVGLQQVIDLANRAGITTPMPKDVGLSLALGSNTVTPLELANAFATFPAGGERAPWRLLTQVNEEVVPPKEEPVAAFKPETAYVMVSLMRSVVEQGTARAAGARIRRPIAGKTGTSSDSKDAWFVGFSPICWRPCGSASTTARRWARARRAAARRSPSGPTSWPRRWPSARPGTSPRPRPSPWCASTPPPACCPPRAPTASTRCSSRAPPPGRPPSPATNPQTADKLLFQSNP